MKDFDLKGYLKNNTLLKESVEEQEEVKEEVQKESYGKMKKSELKEKIREEILEAMKNETDDPAVGDYEEAHSGVAEAEGDEEDMDAEADIDIDADVDIEEPADDMPMDEPDMDAGSDTSQDYKEVQDLAKQGEDIARQVGDEGLAKNFNDIQRSVASKTVSPV